MNFKETLFLIESIDVINNKLSFNYNKHNGDLKSSFGKNKNLEPYLKKDRIVGGTDVYSVYKTNNTTILKALKHQNSVAVDNSDYLQFVNRTGLFMSRILKKRGVDVILAPSSSSFFLDDILDNILQRLPNVKLVKNAFRKADPINVSIRHDAPGITDKIVASLQRVIDKARRDGYLELKKVDKKFAKYLTGYIELGDPLLLTSVESRRVVLIDDIVSSGSTFNQMLFTLKQYPIKDLYGLTVFKT